MVGRLRRLAVAGVASIAIIGAGLAAPTTAEARGGHWGGGGGHWHGGGGHWHGGGWGWGGVGLGLATGLALGAGYPYYGYGYYEPYAYSGCYIRRHWVWDGHGHRVWRRVRVCY
jgi:hypothetical protein